MRIAIGIEYDGRRFMGWQVLGQGKRTIQPVVEEALSKVADHPLKVCCAGRTDSGVHAIGQVAHVDTEARRSGRSWVLGANTHLPEDVSVTWAREVAEDFHARYSATGRIYRYVICNRGARPAAAAGRVTWEYRPLDVAPMREAAAFLIGEHDFTAFRASECQSKTPMRNLHRLDVWRRGDLVLIEAQANAFLHHMVRNIAGVLMAIGMGKARPSWAGEVLASCDRTQGGVTAPPDGLYLAEVQYPDQFGLPRPARDLLPG